LIFVWFGGDSIFRSLIAIGAGAAALLGASAVARILRASHFEGFVLIIGLALILEGILTWTVLFQTRRAARLHQL
jgi:hypothetical protein